MQIPDDPGWPRGIALLSVLLPAMRWQLRRNRDGLTTLRSIFLSFTFALVAFGVILPFVTSGTPSGPVMPWLPILVGAAVLSLVADKALVKPLDCSSLAMLGGSYRANFFLRIAFTEQVALFAFVFTFVGGPLWIYDVGAVFALVRFWTAIAPTRAAIQRDQEELNSRGCELSLLAALMARTPEAG